MLDKCKAVRYTAKHETVNAPCRVLSRKVVNNAKCTRDSSGLKPPAIKWRTARLTQRVQYVPQGTGRGARCGLVKAAQAAGTVRNNIIPEHAGNDGCA